MAKKDMTDFLDDVENEGDFEDIDNDERSQNVSSQYDARRRIEELQEQKRLEKILNDFDDYLEA